MALIAGRHPACGGCELGRARGHLERAVAELEQARLAWGVWADGVRKMAEQATGISVAEGFALLDDAGYAQALRMGAAYDDAADAAGAGLAAADCPCLGVKARIGSPHP